ncbi:unnamed protein product [Spirodela intermedia]|uniref:Uncharacterized protein n=1 Tax=Spirodela intermedia TaxID=51605 RepID=A0A7I8J4M0_SPIIN|nr:unnamed protein product [Spirodela intermedia]CAA6665021.1 unnamed protein product [Spirodela intermedia]
MPVRILSFLPASKEAAMFLTAATDLAALEVAPSLFLPLMTAEATPSKAICSAVFPIRSSIEASESRLEQSSSDPIAAILWKISNPLAEFFWSRRTSGLEICMASLGVSFLETSVLKAFTAAR